MRTTARAARPCSSTAARRCATPSAASRRMARTARRGISNFNSGTEPEFRKLRVAGIRALSPNSERLAHCLMRDAGFLVHRTFGLEAFGPIEAEGVHLGGEEHRAVATPSRRIDQRSKQRAPCPASAP